MCGKAVRRNIDIVANYSGATIKMSELKRNNRAINIQDVLPGQLVEVLIISDKKQITENKIWGYEIFNKLIYNCRSETFKFKPSFRDNLACIIPMSGFYEGGKLFTSSSDTILYLAGLYKRNRFVMLTQPAIGTKVESYYHRCPIVLDNNDSNLWINNKVLRHSEELYRVA